MRGDGRFGKRRILCVFPKYTRAFGTWEHAYPLTDGVQAFMPPQGLLVVAAYLPADWEVRFVDENIRAAAREDFAWAEAVLVSGMHIQRRQMIDICSRAHEFDVPAIIGGPSVSACPENYPTFDYLHVGELGDATDDLIARLARDPSRPPQQVVLKTVERLDMAKFPLPAYDLIDLRKYFLANIQYSSGCPYQCEFCDIPGLYGRNPRLKTPAQLVAELDKLLECGATGSIYFVDDNFIGNRKAALELLPHLVAWQKRTGFQVRLACEATLNIAKRPEILRLMREAYFTTIFCGIETPDPVALKSIAKDHNMMVPIMEAIKTLNDYGIEIASGIILGLDTDKPETGEHLMQFVEQSQIPLLTINLLQALPKTPLYDRLKRENRLNEDDELESNVKFLLPYDDVVTMWRRAMSAAYEPGKVLSRYLHQSYVTYPNRIKLPPDPRRSSWQNIKRGIKMMRNIVWRLGIVGNYKRAFWAFAGSLLLRGNIEDMIASIIVAHHVIVFSREASDGRARASYYSAALEGASVPAE
jgi:radical SAM superfamily enzyme YgiQ (UPF0313 family)